ncbi:MAG: alpha-galactosidase [Planctomycetota bacterium]|nr:alpha-galactosidase [Planctomycetota bacterium]
MKLEFLLAGVAFLLMAAAAMGVTPTADELAQARQWSTDNFGANLGPKAARPPFSFLYDGKPAAVLLDPKNRTESPTEETKKTKSADGGPRRRTITWLDPATQLEIRCELAEYADAPATSGGAAAPVVEWTLWLTNRGQTDTPIIDSLRAIDVKLAIPGPPRYLHHSLGDSNSWKSFALADDNYLTNREGVLSPGGGRSSNSHLPYYNMSWQGGGALLAIGWSGQWEIGVWSPSPNSISLRAGQQTTHFRLHPGETVRSPRIALLFWQGPSDLRGNNLFRQWTLSHIAPRRDGKLVFPPICGSVFKPAKDGSYEQPHLDAMPPYAQAGVECFWSDMDPQQWYPGGFPNGTGNWMVDKGKYPRGLGPVGQAAHDNRLQYLVWVEPERVAPGTQVAKEHPEFVHGGAGGGLFKLDDPTARAWLAQTLDHFVDDGHIDWLRWDFNIQPLEYWLKNDAPDRRGVTEMKYIAGLYDLWDGLRQRHPGLMIDNCASGGRRIDLETTARAIPLWHSDMQCSGQPSPVADQLQNAGLFRWIPMHGCGNFTLDPYGFRSAMTAGNVFTPTFALLDPASRPKVEPGVKACIALYQKLRPYTLGDFHPLFLHTEKEDVWFGYQFDLPKEGKGVAIVFRREKSTEAKQTLRLQGIDPEAQYVVRYEDSNESQTLAGKALAAMPAEIGKAPGTMVLYYERK